MKLTRDVFQNVLRTLSTERKQDERRGAPRVGIAASVTIVPLIQEQPQPAFSARVRDIATGGIGILHSACLGERSHFVLALPVTDEKPLLILCQVRNWRLVADGLFVIGATFLREGYEIKGPRPSPAAEEARIRKAILA